MTLPFIQYFCKKLIDNGLVDDEATIEACTNAEIAELEQKLNIKFPAVYRAYLEVMGRQAGDFLRGEEHSYPDLLTLKEGAQEILADSEITYRLSPTDFVFWMSQGTQFAFFDTSVGDDPLVFHYREYTAAPIKRHDHLSEFLDYMLDTQLEISRQAYLSGQK
jgi:hypothetical protein